MSMTSEFGMGDLHADRRRQAIAHGPEPAGRHPAVRVLELEELSSPHLVLADFRGDVGVVAARQSVEPLDRVLRHDHVVALLVGEAFPPPPAIDRRPPRFERRLVELGLLRLPGFDHLLEHLGAVADDWDVDPDVLVDRGAVDIDMDLLGARREGIDPAGDAVIEARADADHHVAIVHGVVGLVGAMHAEHAEPLLVGGRISAEPHQRRGDGKPGHAHELARAWRSQAARNL